MILIHLRLFNSYQISYKELELVIVIFKSLVIVLCNNDVQEIQSGKCAITSDLNTNI